MSNNSSFSDLLKNKVFNKQINSNIKPDTIVEGLITNRITKRNGEEYFLINAGLKSDGIVAVKDFYTSNDNDNTVILPKIGDKIKLIIIKQSEDGTVIFSYSKLKRKALIEKIKSLYEKSQPTEIKVEIELNNGYKVHIMEDVFGFLPNEDCLTDSSGNLIKYQRGDIIPEAYISRFIKSNISKIQVSLTKIKNVLIGDIVECVVKEVIGDVVFVFVQNCNIKEGILHKSDIDFQHQYLLQTKSENSFKAKIVSIDDNQNKLILSIKKIIHDKWNEVSFNIGEEAECEIAQINEVGLVVVLNNGIEGFIHIYEVDWNVNDINLSTQFHIRQKIKASIILLDKQKKQIKLSIKQLTENLDKNPFNHFIKTYKPGDIVKDAIVLKNNDAHGALSFRFVQLMPGVDGRLTIRDMHWNETKAQEMFSNLKTDQKIDVIITKLDPAAKRVYISVKEMTVDSFDENIKKLQMGVIYNCEVTESNFSGLKVILIDNGGCEGFIKKTELDINTSVTWRQFNSFDKQVIQAKLIGKEGRSLLLSIKAKQRDEQIANMTAYCPEEKRPDNNILDLF